MMSFIYKNDVQTKQESNEDAAVRVEFCTDSVVLVQDEDEDDDDVCVSK